MFKTNHILSLSAIVPTGKTGEIVNDLYEKGICEVRESKLPVSESKFLESSKELDEAYLRLKTVESALLKYRKEKKQSLLNPIKPHKEKTTIKNCSELVTQTQAFLDTAGKDVLSYTEIINSCKEKIQTNVSAAKTLMLLPEVNLSSLRSTENIDVFVGTVNKEKIHSIKDKFDNKCIMITKDADKSTTIVICATSKRLSESAEKILDHIDFNRISLPDIAMQDVMVSDAIMEMKKENYELKKKISENIKELARTYKETHIQLDVLIEEVGVEQEKLNALNSMTTTKSFTILELWLPEKNKAKLLKTIEKHTSRYYIEYSDDENAPTMLNNPAVVDSFEIVTELYSVPKSKRLDPTPIMAFTLPLFFGFMLTDVVYGLVLLALGLLLYIKIGKYDVWLRKAGTLLTVFGVATVIMGVIFTSYLGDFFQRIGVNVPVVIDPMRQVMLALSIAIGIGVLHLFVGLIFGFFENIKLGNTRDAISTQGVWIIFMAGIGLLAANMTLGLCVIGISVLLEMYFKFCEGGTMSSILAIFGFSGFIGDVFSYARLMALGVGTAGIALAVNFLTLMAKDMIPVVGIVLAVLIFVVGHVFNMFMNGLGAFIHSIRLHFLEFFQKFYEGGGNKYRPFKANRIKTVLTEE